MVNGAKKNSNSNEKTAKKPEINEALTPTERLKFVKMMTRTNKGPEKELEFTIKNPTQMSISSEESEKQEIEDLVQRKKEEIR